MTNKVIKKFSNTNDSVREVARKLQLKKSTVQDIKTRNGIHTNKCQIAPKSTANQLKRAKTNSRKVYRKSINKVLIIDDESYVMCDQKNTSGPKYYNFIDKSSVPDGVRFKCKEKFPKRYLVWQAIDEFGNVSEPYIKIGTLKADEYRIECLEKRLLPFIGKYHSNKEVLF
jgi:hypothetical protein